MFIVILPAPNVVTALLIPLLDREFKYLSFALPAVQFADIKIIVLLFCDYDNITLSLACYFDIL